MRPFFVICLSLAFLVAWRALAQTNVASSGKSFPVTAIVSSNTITFPVLLSRDSEPLMTNAVFHRTFGRKVIFGADLSIQSFDFYQLHPSVLAQLHLDPDQLKTDQLTLDQQYQQWAARFRQQVGQYLTAGSAISSAATNATDSTATNAPPHHWHYRYVRASAGHKTASKNPPAHVN